MSDENKDISELMVQSQNLHQLIQIVGHEIYNPLFSINGYADLLLMAEHGKANPNSINREEALQIIKTASDYLEKIIIGMREILRQNEAISVSQDVRQVVSTMAYEIHAQVIVIDGYSRLLLMIEQGEAEPNILNREQALQTIRNCSNHISKARAAMYEFAQQIENTNPKE